MKFSAIAKAWLPVVLWLVLMFLTSTDLMSGEHTSRILTPLLHWLKPDISPATVAKIHLFVRKAAHVTEYAILCGLLFRALRGSIDEFWRRALVALLPVLVIAPIDEFHQSFVPSRTASARDVFIDYCGAFVAILVCRMVHQASRRRAASSG